MSAAKAEARNCTPHACHHRLVYAVSSLVATATVALQITTGGTSKSLPRFFFEEDPAKQTAYYGVDAGDDVLIVVFVSVLFVVAGDGFTIVVLVSFFSPAGGFTVSVFCSQAASNVAAPTRRQMCFFIRL